MKLSFADYKKPGAKVEISIAPLIDIMFLLVIFFMVSTVFPDNKGIAVNKPEMKTASELGPDPVKLVISREGHYYFRGARVSLDRAELLAFGALRNNPDRIIIIEADKEADVEHLTEALDKFKSGMVKSFPIAIAATRAENVR